jgi:hypothetical protein
MTTNPRNTNRLGRRRLFLVAGVVAGSLLLSGCVKAPTDAPKTPSPTQTSSSPKPVPTQSAAEAPKNESDAITAARAALASELKIIVQVDSSGGTDLTLLATIATGPELTAITQSSNEVAKNRWTVTGSLNFEYDKGYAADLTGQDGTKYPFSSVVLTGCQDASKYVVKLPDGTSPQRTPDLRTINTVTVIRDPKLKTWFVQNTINSGGKC